MLELTNYKLGIACLLETKKKDWGKWNLSDFLHIWSGVEKSTYKHASGAIIVKKELKSQVKI